MNKLNECKWRDIDWVKSRANVRKWQCQIYDAAKSGDIKEVRRCQHVLTGLMDAKLLAVRQITQDNKRKSTPGMDNISSVPSNQRIGLAKSLKIFTPGNQLRRIWIPKPGTKEKRPLSIPTIYDRCLQALFKLALEPEWEAKFEANSYGFRPGRSGHDAIAAVRNHLLKGDKFVLNADISKCFDHINHDYLLNKMGLVGKYRKQIKSWLKCGVLDGSVFGDTDESTPQGGVISPLLANIALHGMESFCKDLISKTPAFTSRGTPIKSTKRGTALGVIRYADDFVITHPQLETILVVEKELSQFLAPIGLELSKAKTRIVHSLKEITDDTIPNVDRKPGFNFLGFHFRQYRTVHRSMKDTKGKYLGYRTIVVPSDKSLEVYRNKLHKIVLKDGKKKGLTQDDLIAKLNQVILGWTLYYGVSDANTMGVLTKLDYILYLKTRQWAKRVYKGSGKGVKAYRKVGTLKWTFSTGRSFLSKHIDYSRPLNNYKKVKQTASPYDGNDKYWEDRLVIKYSQHKRISKLLVKQKRKCAICDDTFLEGDIMEVDHIIPRSLGGQDIESNVQLLHRHCHQYKSAQDGSHKVKRATEEPDETDLTG
uniref:Putative reverse transcriptase, intron maturase and HNH endonuclease n=1 Tax=Rhexinema sarcinoideum TaxID=43261 RepID=A0A1B2RYS6_9CHLO|nr:putative reverse transcriptase, intron maturase and HNH endonuclease [Rhexinema sarcinoideum]